MSMLSMRLMRSAGTVGFLTQWREPSSPLSSFWKHGPYLELGYHWWTIPLDDTHQWFARLSTSVHGDVIFANNLGNTIGFGTGAQMSLELVSYAIGVGADTEVNSNGDVSAFVGGVAGEWGGGLTAGIDYRVFDGATYGVFQMGLFFRFPAVAGLLIVSDSDSTRRSRGSQSEGGAQPARRSNGSVEVRSHESQSSDRPSVEVRGTN